VGVNANQRFRVLKTYHGMLFSRNGRLIDVQARTPWTTFINNDRYIKVEVEFSAALDEHFGVTTSKQQVTVSPFIWEVLQRAGVPKAIEQLRNKVREAKTARRIDLLVGASIRSGNGSTECGSQGQLALRPAGYRLAFEDADEAPFFRVDRAGGTPVLHLNMTHPFFWMVYAAEHCSGEMRTALEALLLSAGGHEAAPELLSWSRRLNGALRLLNASSATRNNPQDSSAAGLGRLAPESRSCDTVVRAAQERPD
jgi:hypothetical protein